MNKTVLEILSWEEPAVENFSAENAVNTAKVKYKASGRLNGIITSVYLIHYTVYNPKELHLTHSTFTGYSRFEGTISGKSGSVVFLETGEHNENGLLSTLTIKPDSVTDDFRNLKGKSSYIFENNQVILLTEF